MIIYGADISGSLTVTGSVNIGGSLTANSVTGSFSGVATTASLAFTASSADSFTVRQSATASNMLLTGTLVAQTINVQQVTSSIVYSSGSNRFGNQLTDVQQITGSLRVTGSGDHWVVGGNVGIGTTTPGSKLVIDTATAASSIPAGLNIRNSSLSNSGVLTIGIPAGASAFAAGSSLGDIVIRNEFNKGDLILTSTYGNLKLGAGGSDGDPRIFISGSGNIGIGTTTPAVSLEVNGRYRTTSTFGSSGTTVFDIYNVAADGFGAYIGAASGSNYAFRVADYQNNIKFSINGNGNVGINNTNPTSRLTVVSTNAVGSLRLEASASINALSIGGEGRVSIDAPGVPGGRFIILDNGNLGIGTTAPNRKLEVTNQNGITDGIRLTYAGSPTSEGLDITYLNTGATTTSFDSIYNSDSAVMQFRMKTNGTPVTAMTILGSGNLGIGTATPSYKLDVSGSIATSGSLVLSNRINSSSLNEIYFSDNGQIRSIDDNHRIIFDRANNNLELREYGSIIFSAGSTTGTRTDSVRITGAGKVGIGTNNPSTSELLQVNGRAKSTGFITTYASVSATSGVATNIYTLPTGYSYMLLLYFRGPALDTSYIDVGILYNFYNGSTNTAVYTPLVNGANLTVDVSGGNLRVNQISGTTTTIYVDIVNFSQGETTN